MDRITFRNRLIFVIVSVVSFHTFGIIMMMFFVLDLTFSEFSAMTVIGFFWAAFLVINYVFIILHISFESIIYLNIIKTE